MTRTAPQKLVSSTDPSLRRVGFFGQAGMGLAGVVHKQIEAASPPASSSATHACTNSSERISSMSISTPGAEDSLRLAAGAKDTVAAAGQPGRSELSETG